MNNFREGSLRGLETFQWIKTGKFGATLAIGILRDGLRISQEEVFESDFFTFVSNYYELVALDVTLHYAPKQSLYSEIQETNDSFEIKSFLISTDEEVDENNKRHRRIVSRRKFKQTQTRAVTYLRPKG